LSQELHVAGGLSARSATSSHEIGGRLHRSSTTHRAGARAGLVDARADSRGIPKVKLVFRVERTSIRYQGRLAIWEAP
jgi:hypothetical protein